MYVCIHVFTYLFYTLLPTPCCQCFGSRIEQSRTTSSNHTVLQFHVYRERADAKNSIRSHCEKYGADQRCKFECGIFAAIVDKLLQYFCWFPVVVFCLARLFCSPTLHWDKVRWGRRPNRINLSMLRLCSVGSQFPKPVVPNRGTGI